MQMSGMQMNCQEFDDRLDTLLDDRIDPLHDQALIEHTWRCEECSRKLMLQDNLLRILPLAAPAPPDALAQKRSRQRPTASTFSRIPALVTAAAGLLFFSLFGIPGHNAPTGPQLISPPRPSNAIISSLATDDTQSPRDSRTNLASIATHPDIPWAPSTVEAIFVEARPELTIISTRVARPFRPVATSVVSAWDVIRQTFPGSTRTS
jgi:hypothetical protein